MTQPPESEDIIERLNDFLMSDKAPEDSMLLSDLDGFLTAIAIGPDLILPSQWLPVVWGGEEPVFDDLQEAQAIHGAILQRYNQILAEVERHQPNPILWATKDGDVIADDWVNGFMHAIDLNPAAWDKLFQAEHMTPYFLPILALAYDESGPLTDVPDEVEQILEVIEEAIPICITEIAEFWRKRRSPAPAASPKVGRNDPCPCGSGKKCRVTDRMVTLIRPHRIAVSATSRKPVLSRAPNAPRLSRIRAFSREKIFGQAQLGSLSPA